MSFFKDFKEDFSQAMNELMPDNNEVYDDIDLELDLLEDDIEQQSKPIKSKKTAGQKKDKSKVAQKKVKKETNKKQDFVMETNVPKQNASENQDDLLDLDDIAPEDLLDQIDDILDQELYGVQEQTLPDDLEVNTMDMSVQDLLNQLSEQDELQNIEEKNVSSNTNAESVEELTDITEPTDIAEADNIAEIADSQDEADNITETANSQDEAEDIAETAISQDEETEQLSIDDLLNELENATADVNALENLIDDSVEETKETEEIKSASDEAVLSDQKEFANQIEDMNEEQALEELIHSMAPNSDIPAEHETEALQPELPIDDSKDYEEQDNGTEVDYSEVKPDISTVVDENINENINEKDDLTTLLEDDLDTLDNTINESVEEETSMNDEKDVISINSVENNKSEQDNIAKDSTPVASTQERTFNVDTADTETTYITKGTTIKGNIETDGSIDIIGKVEGSVICQGKIVVGGQVLGDVTAGELYANNARIEGGVKSYGSVKVGVGSIIIGNIESESAVIAGAVNGDLDVKGPVIVDSTAVIMGNIKSRSVQINNGAVIEGFCSQSYSDIDVKSFFA
ncbi:MAG: polymer-forming cytoskeletal protein [Eubacteriales bacterium]|nr:polymer-forming cytoskeletal protein [Eubacteriales bacterium]